MRKKAIQTTYTASEARDNLYQLVRDANILPITIHVSKKADKKYLSDVVVMDKETYERIMETLDVMSNPEEMDAIREARKNTGRLYSMEEVQRMAGL